MGDWSWVCLCVLNGRVRGGWRITEGGWAEKQSWPWQWPWQVGLLWAVYNSFVSRGHGKENSWKGVSAAASHKMCYMWSWTSFLNGADSTCVTCDVFTFDGVTFQFDFRRGCDRCFVSLRPETDSGDLYAGMPALESQNVARDEEGRANRGLMRWLWRWLRAWQEQRKMMNELLLRPDPEKKVTPSKDIAHFVWSDTG